MKKRIALILALIFILSSFVVVFSGCKKDAEGEETTAVDLSAEAEKEQYNREPEDLGGFELNILGVESGIWNMHTDIAPTELNGQVINTAVYERNMLVETLYNAKIVAHEDAKYYHGTEKFSMDQMSKEYVYDAAYLEASSVQSVLSEGHLMNLYDVPELQLDQNWWSQLIKKEATLGSGKYSKLYFAQSNLSLTAFDLTWCVYFNKDIYATRQQKDNLYDLVRNNEWTIDKMKTIALAACDLGEDDSFTYKADGTSIYGITTYWNGAKALLDGGNIQFITKDIDGEYVPNIRNERFINLSQDLAGLFGTSGAFTYGGPSTDGTTTGNASDYIKIFNAKRALFCVAEVKSSVTDFREFDGEFGILPLPKYDDSQTEYRSWINYLTLVLGVPASLKGDSERLHKTTLLLDVLSFYSERDVIPQYYDVVLKGRGAKDVDSEEMLDYINRTKSFDAGVAYGWSRDLSERLSNSILEGSTDVSSLVETYEEIIKNKIKETMDFVYKD